MRRQTSTQCTRRLTRPAPSLLRYVGISLQHDTISVVMCGRGVRNPRKSRAESGPSISLPDVGGTGTELLFPTPRRVVFPCVAPMVTTGHQGTSRMEIEVDMQATGPSSQVKLALGIAEWTLLELTAKPFTATRRTDSFTAR